MQLYRLLIAYHCEALPAFHNPEIYSVILMLNKNKLRLKLTNTQVQAWVLFRVMSNWKSHRICPLNMLLQRKWPFPFLVFYFIILFLFQNGLGRTIIVVNQLLHRVWCTRWIQSVSVSGRFKRILSIRIRCSICSMRPDLHSCSTPANN